MSGETIKELEHKIRKLKHEVRVMQVAAEERNKELAAMHYVFCDGGCAGGVHFYDGKGPDAITEDIVKIAERNTRRLRSWWENRQRKLDWRVNIDEVDGEVPSDPTR